MKNIEAFYYYLQKQQKKNTRKFHIIGILLSLILRINFTDYIYLFI
jgi:hypothetical protein